MISDIIDPSFLVLLTLIAIAVLAIFMGTQMVPDGYSRIVERLGRRHRTLAPGVNFIVPVLDRVKKTGLSLETIMENGQKRVALADDKGNISIAEQRMDPPTQKFLGRDNSEIHIDSVAYFKIIDPIKTVYDVAAFSDSFMSLIETTLRQEVGKLDGDTVITSREALSEKLRAVLQEATTAWGIRLLRVEIEDIHFDEEVTEKLSMARRQELIRRADIVDAQARAEQDVLKAEAEKKSAILRAEGERQALIVRAEGEKQSKVLIAEGFFEEQRLEAEARFLLQSREQEGLAQGFAAISAAIAKNPEGIIALESLKAQAKIAESLGKSSNALIVPNEVAGLFGAMAATIKGLDLMKK
jgi:regulator of protease activity HflC (stomatin/prohibitin superfamily)